MNSKYSDIQEVVRTEEPINNGMMPDVAQGSQVFEIETLFAEDRKGGRPQKKLQQSIEKYEGTGTETVNIVMDNLTLLRHIGVIVELKKQYRKWEREHSTEVEFLTLNLSKERLVPVEEAMKDLKEIEG